MLGADVAAREAAQRRAPPGIMQATQMKPACLPEQLLCSALGSLPARCERARDRFVATASARRIRARSASSPALASMRAAAARAPARRRATRRRARAPRRSARADRRRRWRPAAAPAAAFTAERGKTGRSTSPMAATTAPSASSTATAPRCADSTCPPRNSSTRTGFTGRIVGVACWPAAGSLSEPRYAARETRAPLPRGGPKLPAGEVCNSPAGDAGSHSILNTNRSRRQL